MNHHFKAAHLVLAASCLFILPVQERSSYCQDAVVASPQQDPNGQPVQPPNPHRYLTPEQRQPLPDDVRYYLFIKRLGGEDDRIQQETRELEEGQDVKVEWRDYSASMGIRKDEAQAMLTTVLDAYHRLKENERQLKAGLQEFHDKYGIEQALKMPLPPELQALEKDHDAIVIETIARLKQELGSECFKRVDVWVSHRWGKGKSISTPTSTSIPNPHEPNENPASIQTPSPPDEYRRQLL